MYVFSVEVAFAGNRSRNTWHTRVTYIIEDAKMFIES
jgi:hypothetical protein